MGVFLLKKRYSLTGDQIGKEGVMTLSDGLRINKILTTLNLTSDRKVKNVNDVFNRGIEQQTKLVIKERKYYVKL